MNILERSLGNHWKSCLLYTSELREKLIYEIAFIESALDDPEHISLDGYPERLRETLQPIEMELEASIGTFDNGRIMTEGIKTVILGKPNAGKSSLMNVLLGEDLSLIHIYIFQ